MQSKKPTSKIIWLSFAIGGLVLIGFGLSLFGEALSYKLEGRSFIAWGTWGTAALVCFNAGISCFGRAVIERIKILKKSNKLY